MNSINPADVLSVIQRHTQDNRATKRMIAQALGLPYANKNNDPIDRAIRAAVSELRKQGYPILCTTEGAGGYGYDQERVDIVIRQYKKRIIDMSETVPALERGRVKSEIRQLELIGG